MKLLLGAVLGLLVLLVPGVARASVKALSSPLPGVTVVEGALVPFLHGTAIVALRVYAFPCGSHTIPAPMPFQVDERDRRERWVLDHEGQDEHAGQQAGDPLSPEFSDKNVIVLMNRDLGCGGDLDRLPAGATVWGEVRVGAETTPLGFAYLGVFPNPPLLACVSCVTARYDRQGDRVYAQRYAVEFDGALPSHIGFVERLGEFGSNVIAGVRANGEVRFLGGLFTLRRTEADIHTERISYRQGPVRVIRRARYWIPLLLGLRTTGRVDLLFYQDFVEGTALVKLKVPPRLVLADGELRAYFDFLALQGARVFLDNQLLDDVVNGRMTPVEQRLGERAARAAALVLPDGRTVWVVIRLEGALEKLDQRLYFADLSRPDGQVGGLPLIGFEFSQVHRLETGVHRLSVFAGILDSVAPVDIQRTLDIFLTPPPVSVSVVQPE